jgi:hypothetical protein
MGMKRASTWLVVFALVLVALAMPVTRVSAIDQFPDQSKSGSIGLQGTISTAAPKTGATITTPGNGATFSTTPITVSGLCPKGLLVKVFSNNVFVGSIQCDTGSYSLQIDLFSGQNELVARVYDALDQAGPDSNTVTVTYNSANFAQFGTQMLLTSIYASRGAPPSQEITWPILLSGGTGPYAISVDWGDGTPIDLISQESAGGFTIKHTYKTAGVYKIIVKATDKNKDTAFLQLVGVATGATQSKSGGGDKSGASSVRTVVIWWPCLLMLPLIVAAFWVGRRNELFVLRKKLEKSRDKEEA